MSEAELTEQLLMVNEQVFLAISVTFTVVSAYILGLYWFLHKGSLLLRLEAFFMFSLILAMLFVTGFGLSRHSDGIILALKELQQSTPLTALGRMSIQATAQGVSTLLTTGGALIGVFVYLGLGYMTFLYHWPDMPRSPSADKSA